MDLLSIVILAIGLAADCFAVSVCKGMTTHQLPWMRVILMALLFGLFQGGMPLLTFFLGIGFAQYIKGGVNTWNNGTDATGNKRTVSGCGYCSRQTGGSLVALYKETVGREDEDRADYVSRLFRVIRL